MLNPDDWAKNTRKKLHEKREAPILERQESLRRKEMLQTELPELWHNVVDSFKRLCGAYNSAEKKEVLTYHSPGPDVFEVRRTDLSGRSGIILERVGDMFSVQWGTRRDAYQAEIALGSSSLRLVSEGHATTPDDIAARSLEMLLGL